MGFATWAILFTLAVLLAHASWRLHVSTVTAIAAAPRLRAVTPWRRGHAVTVVRVSRELHYRRLEDQS